MLRVFRRQAQYAAETVVDGCRYTRHLLRGSKITGQLTAVRPDCPPVVLVHGFLGTRGTMQPLSSFFQAEGRAVFSYSHGRLQSGCLRRAAQDLIAQVKAIREQLDCDRVDLVGFSMGGLVGLHALKFLGAHRYCQSLAMLGTPVRGTWLGLAGLPALGAVSPSLWQLLPNSRFLEDLLVAPMPNSVRVRQIYASRDALCPMGPRLTCVPERDYVVLPGGHSSLVVGRDFHQAVGNFLDNPRPEPVKLRLCEPVDVGTGLST